MKIDGSDSSTLYWSYHSEYAALTMLKNNNLFYYPDYGYEIKISERYDSLNVNNRSVCSGPACNYRIADADVNLNTGWIIHGNQGVGFPPLGIYQRDPTWDIDIGSQVLLKFDTLSSGYYYSANYYLDNLCYQESTDKLFFIMRASNNTVSDILSIDDLNTGATSLVATAPYALHGLACSDSLIYSHDLLVDSIRVIDPVGGTVNTLRGSANAVNHFNDLEYDPIKNDLYYFEFNTLVRLDLDNLDKVDTLLQFPHNIIGYTIDFANQNPVIAVDPLNFTIARDRTAVFDLGVSDVDGDLLYGYLNNSSSSSSNMSSSMTSSSGTAASVSISSGALVAYKPDASFTNTSQQYTMYDGRGGSATGTLNLSYVNNSEPWIEGFDHRDVLGGDSFSDTLRVFDNEDTPVVGSEVVQWIGINSNTAGAEFKNLTSSTMWQSLSFGENKEIKGVGLYLNVLSDGYLELVLHDGEGNSGNWISSVYMNNSGGTGTRWVWFEFNDVKTLKADKIYTLSLSYGGNIDWGLNYSPGDGIYLDGKAGHDAFVESPTDSVGWDHLFQIWASGYTAPGWLNQTISGNEVIISGTPLNSDIGEYGVLVKGSDPYGSVNRLYRLNVLDNAVDYPPQFITMHNYGEFYAGETSIHSLQVDDVNGDPLETDIKLVESMAQNDTFTTTIYTDTISQSFIPGFTGMINSIEFYMCPSNTGNLLLEIRDGVSPTGTILHSENIEVMETFCGDRNFKIKDSISVTAGSSYNFRLVYDSNADFRKSSNDSYLDGGMYVSDNYSGGVDMVFNVHGENVLPPWVTFSGNPQIDIEVSPTASEVGKKVLAALVSDGTNLTRMNIDMKIKSPVFTRPVNGAYNALTSVETRHEMNARGIDFSTATTNFYEIIKDQSNYDGYDYFTINSEGKGQSFKPSSSGTLRGISIMKWNTDHPRDYMLRVQIIDGDTSAGTILYDQMHTVEANNTGKDWINIPLFSGVAVSAEASYTFYLSSNDSIPVGRASVESYSRGQVWIGEYSYNFQDMIFQTWMESLSNPAWITQDNSNGFPEIVMNPVSGGDNQQIAIVSNDATGGSASTQFSVAKIINYPKVQVPDYQVIAAGGSSHMEYALAPDEDDVNVSVTGYELLTESTNDSSSKWLGFGATAAQTVFIPQADSLIMFSLRGHSDQGALLDVSLKDPAGGPLVQRNVTVSGNSSWDDIEIWQDENIAVPAGLCTLSVKVLQGIFEWNHSPNESYTDGNAIVGTSAQGWDFAFKMTKVTEGPTWATADTSSGDLIFNPAISDTGTYLLAARALDVSYFKMYTPFKLDVRDSADMPQINGFPEGEIVLGSTEASSTYPFTFSNLDGMNLHFELNQMVEDQANLTEISSDYHVAAATSVAQSMVIAKPGYFDHLWIPGDFTNLQDYTFKLRRGTGPSAPIIRENSYEATDFHDNLSEGLAIGVDTMLWVNPGDTLTFEIIPTSAVVLKQSTEDYPEGMAWAEGAELAEDFLFESMIKLENPESWVNLDSINQILTLSPNLAPIGRTSISMHAWDEQNHVDRWFDVVIDPPPTVLDTPATQLFETDTFSILDLSQVFVDEYDPWDSLTVTWSSSVADPNITVSHAGDSLIVYLNDPQAPASETINVFAEDPRGQSAFVTIQYTHSGTAPVLENPISYVTVTGDSAQLDLDGLVVEGDTLNIDYEIQNNNVNLDVTLDTLSSLLTVKTFGEWIGTDSIQIKAMQNNLSSQPVWFYVTFMAPATTPPVLYSGKQKGFSNTSTLLLRIDTLLLKDDGDEDTTTLTTGGISWEAEYTGQNLQVITQAGTPELSVKVTNPFVGQDSIKIYAENATGTSEPVYLYLNITKGLNPINVPTPVPVLATVGQTTTSEIWVKEHWNRPVAMNVTLPSWIDVDTLVTDTATRYTFIYNPLLSDLQSGFRMSKVLDMQFKTGGDSLTKSLMVNVAYTDSAMAVPTFNSRSQALQILTQTVDGAYKLTISDAPDSALLGAQWIVGEYVKYPLQAGTYRMRVDLYGDSTQRLPLKTWSNSVNVESTPPIFLLPDQWGIESFGSQDTVPEDGAFISAWGWDDALSLDPLYQRYYSMQPGDELVPGVGYWISSQDSINIAPEDLDPAEFAPVSVELSAVNEGWNLIANPYPWPVHAMDVDATKVFFAYNSNTSSYYEATILMPHTGYWVQVEEEQTLTFSPQPWFGSLSEASTAAGLTKQQGGGVLLQLSLAGGGALDGQNYLGIGQQNSALAKPPLSWGEKVRLDILSSTESAATPLSRAIIPETLDQKLWRIRLLSTSDRVQSGTLEISGVQTALEQGYRVILAGEDSWQELDTDGSVQVALSKEPEYYTIQLVDRNSQIITNALEIRPEVLRNGTQRVLQANFQFTPEIVAALRASGETPQLQVFDLDGNLITSVNITNYGVGWNKEQTAIPSVNGVLLVRLKAGTQQTGAMTRSF